MKIVIKKLTLRNFKGIPFLEILFNHITNIFGENAAGKTTIFDAFLWLLFGKDSTDRKDFELKPLDTNGKPMQKVDVEVSAEIEIDGKFIEIKKILREKWVKKRGDLIPEFTGNENLFYWNDVPLQLKQYQEKINDILNENIFKLITNPLYFNSMKWQDRREVLLKIAGTISNEDLLMVNPDFASLIKVLGDKSLDEYKREIAVKKKKLKDDLQDIPTRIDQINKTTPEVIDFDAIRKQIADKTHQLESIDATLQNAVKTIQAAHEGLRAKQNQLHELKTRVQNIKQEVRQAFADAHTERKNKISQLDRKVSEITSSISNSKLLIENLQREISTNTELKANLVKEWETESEKELVFTDDQFNCPSCKQPLPADKTANSKTQLQENFNKNKSTALSLIEQKGLNYKKRIEELTEDLQTKNGHIAVLSSELTTIKQELEEFTASHQQITANAESEFNKLLEVHETYNNTLKEITVIEEELSAPMEEADNSSLKEQKANINIELDQLKKKLTDEERIQQAKDWVEELQVQEGKLAQQLVDLEGSEYMAEQYTKAKMDTLVSRINNRFKYVTFKLFDTQINGGEVECCDTLVNGVPFSDANNAARINAGIDIINTLCEHYGVYAPIFIDNRESVNNLIDCNSQVVNLIVSTDKKLRVA